eukprot:CAMPEP_0118932858 /NCGR_PEP_ID=MMETSP1169-20130426/10659_1 /TAXON_ID=36882 /ORGANISM="Pyramimonas obovata, Strain CCMP722" /LENGTH=156 /DNA_ID=CAMNT_0006875561 /DNA_START=54 /DNA_END=524 /DNA_ORIENTATION=+
MSAFTLAHPVYCIPCTASSARRIGNVRRATSAHVHKPRAGVVCLAAKGESDPEPKYSAAQLEFMKRKEKREMPTSNQCKTCEGTGLCDCGVCGGTGMNGADMNLPEGDQITRAVNTNPMLYDADGACWFCRGARLVACKECAGSGIENLSAKWETD